MHTAITLCRARGSVAGDACGRFQSTAVAQVSGDVGTAQAVMGNSLGKPASRVRRSNAVQLEAFNRGDDQGGEPEIGADNPPDDVVPA